MCACKIKASAPGSLMLLGEHAVVRDGRALVAAITPRISVEWTPYKKTAIKITSRFGESLLRQPKDIDLKGPHRFIIAAIAQQQKLPPEEGFHLKVTSEFSHEVGWGSSAAVVAATLAALAKASGKPIDRPALLRQGRKVIRKVQGTGSGADVAASVYGGLVGYRLKPSLILPISCQDSPPLTVVYSGYKTPTVEVIKKVNDLRRQYPTFVDAIFKAIDEAAMLGITATQQKDWKRLGEIFDIHQGCMEALGVSDAVLSSIAYNLRKKIGIYGAKISGAGLGDCIVGLGHTTKRIGDYKYWEMAIAPEGVIIEDC